MTTTPNADAAETSSQPHRHATAEHAAPHETLQHRARHYRASPQGAIRHLLLPGSIVLAALLVSGAWVYTTKLQTQGTGSTKGATTTPASSASTDVAALTAAVFPKDGVALDIAWKDTGKRLVDLGVIDRVKFDKLYESRGGLQPEEAALLDGSAKDGIVMTEQNAPFLLNLFWAFGLANKNEILEQGPMSDPKYGGAGGFASTGGWTLAKDDAMQHFSKHALASLTAQQQERVVNVAKNIYRPCCGNATYFPDCNHGMAMLGLLELMAASGASEDEMYKTALAVNSYWFPDTYLTIAKFVQAQGKDWKRVDPKEVLGAAYSSASGYKQVAAQVNPVQSSGGSGCGV